VVVKKKKSVSRGKKVSKSRNNFNRNLLIGVVVLVLLFTFAYYGGGYERVDRTGGLNQVSGSFDLGFFTDMADGMADVFFVDENTLGDTLNVGVGASSCFRDSDCFTGEICSAGACIPGCNVDDDCMTGELCNTGMCEPGCNEDNDCLSGIICAPIRDPSSFPPTYTNKCVECDPNNNRGCPRFRNDVMNICDGQSRDDPQCVQCIFDSTCEAIIDPVLGFSTLPQCSVYGLCTFFGECAGDFACVGDPNGAICDKSSSNPSDWACVECRDGRNGDCNGNVNGNYCGTDNLCVDCDYGDDSTCTSPNNYCEASGTCTECNDNTHCTAPGLGVCDTSDISNPVCVECTNVPHDVTGCADGVNFCMGNKCTECIVDFNCNDPGRPICSPGGVCVNAAGI
jgi:hypothetical protein